VRARQRELALPERDHSHPGQRVGRRAGAASPFASTLALQTLAGNAAVNLLLQRATESKDPEVAAPPYVSVQRGCGRKGILASTACVAVSGDLTGKPYLFNVNCDDLTSAEDARLRKDALGLAKSGDLVEVHGFASTDGPAAYNRKLSCARAERAGNILSTLGVTVTGLFEHGPTPGLRVPHRSVVLHTTHPPPPCGPPPPAPTSGVPLPRDPHIASGSLCRGACGPNCPTTCTPLPNRKVCVDDAAGACHWEFEYPGVISCGSHLGCRNHDACYDRCAAASGETDLCPLGTCHCGCDVDCISDFGVSNCNSWRTGGGPFDSFLTFSDPPTSTGPFPGRCPP
jgi:outer membrane protein OmpA-like peptidoglycan-associated protein